MNRSVAIASVATYLEDFLSDTEAFRGQQLRGGGPVAEFEALLAKRCGYPYCVATCNATSALMGVGLAFHNRNSEVWIPHDHWVGTASAFRSVGCKVRLFRGCDPPKARGKKPGILVTGSRSERPPGFEDWIWIEDSSRLPGHTHPSGCVSSADYQVISLGSGKPLCLGEGGAILCRKRSHYRRLIQLTQHPERHASEFGELAALPELALNARIHPIAAILGVAVLTGGDGSLRAEV